MLRHSIKVFGLLLICLSSTISQADVFLGYISLKVDDVFHEEGVQQLAKYAARGNLKKVNKLVESGVDINSAGKFGMTPLFWAFNKLNRKGYTRLLELGADPNLPVEERYTIIAAAAGLPATYYLELALEYGANPKIPPETPRLENPLYKAMFSNREKNMQILISAGADINSPSAVYRTMYQLASYSKSWRMVPFLLENGADPLIRDKRNENIFDYLCYSKGFLYKGEVRWFDASIELLNELGYKFSLEDCVEELYQKKPITHN